MASRKILIIDDEPSIIDNLVYALNQEGMDAASANTGTAGLKLLAAQPFDLVILDIGLPDMSGIDVCKEIRRESNIPIIFLTARSDEIDRILGLELGADDYVTKPFSPREVTARVKTILRRIDSPTPQDSIFKVDETKKEIHFKNTRLTLTRFEYGILAKLLSHPGQVFSRDSLLDQLWSDDSGASDRVIDTHIKSLRAKLREIDAEQNPIKTHRGFGYSIS
jgi:two-component system catabolic regulation response regulator CreB